jgi:hypothetical protein
MDWDAWIFVLNAGFKLILDILGSSFLCHTFLLYKSSFFEGGIWLFLHHILELIW